MKTKLFQKHDIQKTILEARKLRLIREAVEKSRILYDADVKESLFEEIDRRLETAKYRK